MNTNKQIRAANYHARRRRLARSSKSKQVPCTEPKWFCRAATPEELAERRGDIAPVEEDNLTFIQREVRLAFSTQVTASEAQAYADRYLAEHNDIVSDFFDLFTESRRRVEKFRESVRNATPQTATDLHYICADLDRLLRERDANRETYNRLVEHLNEREIAVEDEIRRRETPTERRARWFTIAAWRYT